MPATDIPLWPVPATERERLRELSSFEIMHTPPEEAYDGLVEIAAGLFDVPMAKLSLVGADAEWFKARIGMDACGNGREVAFCSHTIMGTRAFVVEDAALDPRFQDNPLVTGGPRIRFYVGAPLVTGRGECVGALCVSDTRPRQADARAVRLLERLARQAVLLMEAHRLTREMGDLARTWAASSR